MLLLFQEMLAHHLAVGIPFFIGASSGRYLGGIVCTLFTEINSVFLHWRSLLKMSNPENDSSSMDVRNTGTVDVKNIWPVPSKFQNVCDYGMKIYSFQPKVTALLDRKDRL